MEELKTTTTSAQDEFVEEEDVVPLSTLARAVWLMIKIALPLFIGAIVVAVIFFDVRLAIFASFMGFVLMLFIALPLVLATYEDEVIEGGHD